MPNGCNKNGSKRCENCFPYLWIVNRWKNSVHGCMYSFPSVHICLNGLCERVCAWKCVRWSAFPSLFVKIEIGNCQQNFNHNQQQYTSTHPSFKATKFSYNESITWNLIMVPLKQRYHRISSLSVWKRLYAVSMRYARHQAILETMKPIQMKNNYDSN